jgi:two-component system LytT family sensor kinase
MTAYALFLTLGAVLLNAVGLEPAKALLAAVSLTLMAGVLTRSLSGHRPPQPQGSGSLPLETPQVETTLKIASETLPIMRQGLNAESAHKTAQIIQKISDVAAVAITDRSRVLAFVGAGCENHRPGDNILTEATKLAIATGETKVVENQRQLSCPRTDCDCPLAAAVIVPLKCDGEVVGTLKLYQTRDGALPPYLIRLAQGLAQLLGMQIEMAELSHQAQLATRAELDALRAQINPHFLFNVLNTIIMYSRVNPEKTRRLLFRLAALFRQSLRHPGHFQPLGAELECVRAYLYLEKARFKDKLKVRISVPHALRAAQVPVLVIQPLVENAVKHGIGPALGPGTVSLTVRAVDERLHVQVTDSGVGMPPERLSEALKPGIGSGNGVGLSNVYERMQRLYGKHLTFTLRSRPGEGTTIDMYFPIAFEPVKEALVNAAQSSNRG